MKMETKTWIITNIFIIFYFVQESIAVYCGYKTSTGIIQHTSCMEICCEGPDVTFDNVCCRSVQTFHLYIGLGLTAFVLIMTIVIYCVYTKRKTRRSQQEGDSDLHIQGNYPLPTISLRVEPPQPPPYELHPPPYCTINKETSSKKREILTFPTDDPPAYYQHEGRS